MDSLPQFIGLFILLCMSSFFSMSETALTSVSKLKLRQMAEEGIKKAKKTQEVIDNPKKLLSSILIGNNLVNICASTLSASIAMQFFGNNSKALSIMTVCLTLIILIFCEITPKTFASQNPEKLSLKLANPISVCIFLLSPIVLILGVVTGFIIKLLGGEGKNTPLITEAEIKTLLNVGEEEGILKVDEKIMINNVFDFDDFTAKDVLTPRTNIVAVPHNATLSEVVEVFETEQFSRLPVYEDNLDNIIGILHLKDIAFTKETKQTFNINKYMREPFFTYESKPTRELFSTMRQKSIAFAVILDEYGGTSGIVTLEDLIEEIVGDISDEYDDFVEAVEFIKENEYIARGDAKINDVNDIIGTKIESEDFDSIGGYVMGVVGRVPKKGEIIISNGIKFIIEDIFKNRVEKVRIFI